MSSIAAIRKEYKLKSLDESEAEVNPIKQFDRWWQDAIASDIDEVNALTLATTSSDGKPSARIVLLKGYDSNGFVFFTNYESRKGKELAENPAGCMIFFWKELERQVRIDGTINKVSEAESDAYFFSRPAGSQVGAWVSPQSTVIESRDIIEQRLQQFQQQFAESPITRPPHWGGYQLVPEAIEFWQGRPSRLHDRLRYTRQEDQQWKMERLAP